MNEPLTLVLAGTAGFLLGVLFFGGLWWTVRKGVSSKRPALWFVGSLLLRTGVVLAGFYFVSGGRWERLVACLLGFVMARLGVTLRLRSRLRPQDPARHAGQAWLTRPPAGQQIRPAQEASDAP